MDKNLAEQIANELLIKHGVKYPFSFEKAKPTRFIAKIIYTEKQIVFNETYLDIIKEDEFRNTILHEIAHYLVDTINGKWMMSNRHNSIWKMKHREIGGTGTRCSDLENYKNIDRSGYRFIYHCNSCGHVFYTSRRKTNHHHGDCSHYQTTRERIMFCNLVLMYDRKGQFAPIPEMTKS